MKKKVYIILCAIFIILFASGLTVYAEQFGISHTKITANIGETIDLDLIGTEKTPRWTSYNVNIARVNQDGEVTAVRKGKTTVSARIGLSYKKCTVTVVDSSIKLNKKTATIYTGGTSTKEVQLKATVKGASKEVVWSSDNPKIARVNEKGKVTSVAAGTVTITATANEKTASCVVIVKESDISLNMNAMQLSTKGNGSSIKLTPTIVGSKKSVTWTSSDKTIATVSGGKVTGKQTGNVTITATANGISTTCEVIVIKDSISINSEKEILYVGENKQLKTNANKKDIVLWNSSDETIATIENGKVTAVGAGKAIISVERDGITDTCEIIVKETSTSIGEDVVELRTKGTDKTYTLGYEVIGRKSSVKWASSDKNIATVSKGKVTAKKVGIVTITASANGVSDSVQVTVKDFEPTIKLNQSEYTLYTGKGSTLTLKATVDGTNKTVLWSSSDSSVATVNKGKVKALKEGKTLVTATANGITAECLITVKESKVTLETKNITLDKGEKAQIPADVVGYSQTVKYVSTNSKIVTVKNGIITAKNYGEADIKVSANGVTSICHVKVAVCEHVYDEGVVTKEPSCTEFGIKTFSCTLCGDSYIEDIPLAEHSYEEVVTEPTCTGQGYTTYICSCGDPYKDSYVNALDHDWEEWKTTKEPTEAEVGEKKRTCSRCGEEEIAEIPVTTHEHVYALETIESTCTEQGYTIHICGCGDSYITDYTEALNHNWNEWVTVTEATEELEGLEKHVCNRCGEEETNTIPRKKHEHVYTETVVEPTCTEQGYTEHICSKCDDSYVDEYVDALGCEAGDWIEEMHPSCEMHGYKYQYCIRCNELIAGEEIPALGHNYEGVTTKEATCTEDGLKEYKCTRCGNVSATETIYAAHTWREWTVTKEPASGAHTTVSDFGTQERTCSLCGQTEEEYIINIDLGSGETETLYGTFWDDEAYKTLNMVNELRTSLGLNELKWFNGFEDLGKIRGVEIGYSFSHKRPSGKPRSIIINDFEIDTGENLHMGAIYASSAFNAWKESSAHYNNMVAKSYQSYYCACFRIREYDDFYEEYTYGNCWVQLFTTYDLSGVEDTCEHDYTDVVTEPTCTEQGYTTHTCSKCGDSYADNNVNVLGHNYEWETTKEATSTENGLKEYKCTRCGDISETEIIEASNELQELSEEESALKMQENEADTYESKETVTAEEVIENQEKSETEQTPEIEDATEVETSVEGANEIEI